MKGTEVIRTKLFFDMILPSTIKLFTRHYVCGDSYRCIWAIKEYPLATEELALFSTLADRNNLTIHLYSRMIDAIEPRKIIQNATRKNKLSNMTAIEYIRNASKRVRKKESSVILARQNIDDFLIQGVKEYTKPLLSIPTHQFLFNAESVEPKVYMDVLQIEESEFERIRYPKRGTCLFRCGNEMYLLKVIAPELNSLFSVKQAVDNQYC